MTAQSTTSIGLLTVEEAARYLNVTDRTVRSYIKQGFLIATKKPGSRRRWLNPEEVEELRREKKEALHSLVSRKEIMQLRAKMRRLEAHMEVVLRILDAKSNPLRMSAGYSRELHTACLGQLAREEWDVSEIDAWSEIFLRIDEDDFLRLRESTQDQKPWIPYLRLCVSMTVSITSKSSYASSLELQSLHKKMSEGRRRMRVAAVIYAETHTGVDVDLQRYAMADAPISVSDTLEKVLRRKK